MANISLNNWAQTFENACTNDSKNIFFFHSTEINTVSCVDLTHKSGSHAGTPHCVELTQLFFYSVE